MLGDSGAAASEEVGVIIARLGESGRSAGYNVSCSSVPFALEHHNSAANVVQLPPYFAPKVRRRARGSGAPGLPSADTVHDASIVNIDSQRRERELQDLDESPQLSSQRGWEGVGTRAIKPMHDFPTAANQHS